MSSAIGSLPALSPAAIPGASTAGVEAQIARYKKQLSDCVNCASAKTPAGKAAIQALATKISAAQARIEKAAVSAAPAKSDVVRASTVVDSTKGGRVDVFA